MTVSEATWTGPAWPIGPPAPEPPLDPRHHGHGQAYYPYPTLDDLKGERAERELDAVVLENAFLRLTFLPELNGRLWSCWDKLAAAEVLYANPELKPALVAHRGAWHAGGIEVNFPISHSVTTVDPVSCLARERSDGGAEFVAWNVDAVSGLSWECVTSLEPDAACFTMKTYLANPGDLPQRYYFWVNAAYPIDPDSRYLFAPSCQQIWIESGLGGGMMSLLDYPVHDGVDYSVFANLRAHSPLFATTCEDGFFGLHHPSRDQGIAHIADPSVVCGRKIWSWGFAPDGTIWHDKLTDTGGPYCEVQSGPLRLQTEYRTIAPGQLIAQRDCWLPTRGLGGLSCATDELAAAWTVDGEMARLRLHAASELGAGHLVYNGPGGETRVAVELTPQTVELELPLALDEPTWFGVVHDDELLLAPVALAPHRPRRLFRARAAGELPASQLARWREWHGDRASAARLHAAAAEERPEACEALARYALAAADSETAWRWAQRGLALDYRDPDCLRTAALAARANGLTDEALWLWEELLGHPAGRGQALLGLTDEALVDGDQRLAARRATQLIIESYDVRIDGRLAHAARRLGDEAVVGSLGDSSPLRLDPLLAAERRLADPEQPALTPTAQMLAAERLFRFGDVAGATAILADESQPDQATPVALLGYAAAYVKQEPPPDPPAEATVGFAHGPFAIAVLRHAVRENEHDDWARVQLGCALAAVGEWEEAACHWAVATAGALADLANRNLGLHAWRAGDLPAATTFLEHAVSAGGAHRTWVELDLVLAAQGRHGERLAWWARLAPADLADPRLAVRYVAALVDSERWDEAIDRLSSGEYRVAEGGSLPQELWRRAHLGRAERRLATGQPAAAAADFEVATTYPAHLGVGEPAVNRHAAVWLQAARAWRLAGEPARAAAALERGAAEGWRLPGEPFALCQLSPEVGPPRVPAAAVENGLARVACLRELGREPEADEVLDWLTSLVEGRGEAADWLARLVAARAGGGQPPSSIGSSTS